MFVGEGSGSLLDTKGIVIFLVYGSHLVVCLDLTTLRLMISGSVAMCWALARFIHRVANIYRDNTIILLNHQLMPSHATERRVCINQVATILQKSGFPSGQGFHLPQLRVDLLLR